MSKKLPDPPSDLAEHGPDLGQSMSSSALIDEEWYPAANDLADLDILDDWLEKLDQALIDTRNGVVGIAWPIAVAGVFALATLQAELLARGGVSQLAVWMLLVLTAGLVVAAFGLTSKRTKVRRQLVVTRAGYVRRRREIGATRQTVTAEDPEYDSRRHFLHRLLGCALLRCRGAI